MDKKIFKRTVSDKLKKALVAGAMLFAISGAQEAHAQGFLEKLTNTFEKVNHTINSANIKISNYNFQKSRLQRNIERLDRNTGGAISGAVGGTISLIAAQRLVKQQVQQNGGTYVASPQEFSQTSQATTQVQSRQSGNSQYLNNVKTKLTSKKATNAENKQVAKTVKKQNQTAKKYTKDEMQVASLLGLDLSR